MDNHTSVVIADNSEEFCSALTAALHQTDRFRVLDTANDGERAIALVSEQKPDILVLDTDAVLFCQHHIQHKDIWLLFRYQSNGPFSVVGCVQDPESVGLM